MCGFAGIVSDNIDKKVFENTLNKIRYRGPDYSGIWENKEWILGHNRLSILDLDPRSHQPFHSADGRFSLLFNGEIYNYKELRNQLIAVGYKFQTESDTEVALYSYDKWKNKCFERFHGMFAFALVDSLERKLILARDRFGEKPLFYGSHGREFRFASEIKCLLDSKSENSIDLTSVIDYLHFGFVPAPKTIYTNIYKLRPGHFAEYSISERRILSDEPYYRLSFNHSMKGFSLNDKQSAFDEIATIVSEQISISDVPIGAFLSGGVDSSGVVYFLNRQNSDIHTFTAGFKSKNFDESEQATKIVKHLNLKNTIRFIGFEDFIGYYDKMLTHYEEPHNDFSFIPTYVICKEAEKEFKVMISGDGADEIFCGYPRYHKLKQFSLIKNVPGLANMVSLFSRLLPEYSNLKRQISYTHLNSVDFFYHTMSLNFLPKEATDVFGSDLMKEASHYSSRSIIENHLADIPDERNLIQQQRYLDIKMTLGDDMLVKTDRASMANSLEVRPFYLHPLITEFAFGLNVDDLVRLNIDKWFLKKYLEDKLPRDNLFRPKMGFTFPLKELIQGGPLEALFNEGISALPPELINLSRLKNIQLLHRQGDRNYIAQLHSLMNLGLWLKRNT